MPSPAVLRTAAHSAAPQSAPLRADARHNCAVPCTAARCAASRSGATIRIPIRRRAERWSACACTGGLSRAAECSHLLIDAGDSATSRCIHAQRGALVCTADKYSTPHHSAQKNSAVKRVALCGAPMHRTNMQSTAGTCTAMHCVYSSAINDQHCNAELADRQPRNQGKRQRCSGEGPVYSTARGATGARSARAGSGSPRQMSKTRGRAGR